MSEDTGALSASQTTVDPDAVIGMESSHEDTPYLVDGETVLYKTAEEALKGTREKDATIARMGEKLKALEAAQASSSRDDQIAAALKAVAESMQEPEGGMSLEEIKALIDENPSEGTIKFYQLMERQKDEAYNAKVAALDAKLAELSETLNKKTGDLDPEYRANKEVVDQLQASIGVSREQAMKIVGILPKTVEKVVPETPPSPSVTGRVSAKGAPAGAVTEAEFQEMNRLFPHMHLTREEVARMNARKAGVAS